MTNWRSPSNLRPFFFFIYTIHVFGVKFDKVSPLGSVISVMMLCGKSVLHKCLTVKFNLAATFISEPVTQCTFWLITAVTHNHIRWHTSNLEQDVKSHIQRLHQSIKWNAICHKHCHTVVQVKNNINNLVLWPNVMSVCHRNVCETFAFSKIKNWSFQSDLILYFHLNRLIKKKWHLNVAKTYLKFADKKARLK